MELAWMINAKKTSTAKAVRAHAFWLLNGVPVDAKCQLSKVPDTPDPTARQLQRACTWALRWGRLTNEQRRQTEAMRRVWKETTSQTIRARAEIKNRIYGYAVGCGQCKPKGIGNWWTEKAWPFIKEHWVAILQLCLSVLIVFVL